MKVQELIDTLEKLDKEQDILLCERIFDDEECIDNSYYEIDSIEQWDTLPGSSHHYTIYGGKLISG